jgi:hypothetical protein
MHLFFFIVHWLLEHVDEDQLADFGEIVVWLGVFGFCAPCLVYSEWVSVLSPIFITLLLLFVSGIPRTQMRSHMGRGRATRHAPNLCQHMRCIVQWNERSQCFLLTSMVRVLSALCEQHSHRGKVRPKVCIQSRVPILQEQHIHSHSLVSCPCQL